MNLMGIEPLTPAYGRDYKTLEEAQRHFNENKDFKTPSGLNTNKEDLANMYPDLKSIRVRFDKQTEAGQLTLKGI